MTMMPDMMAAAAAAATGDVASSVEITPCPPEELSCTLGAIPQTSSMLGALPLSIISQPLALESGNDTAIPVIPLRSGGIKIERCRSCRAYINPYVEWLNGCRQWRCNICGTANKVPIPYYSPVDPATGLRSDINERHELTHACVEFEAPSEYNARTPMIPTFLFVIDATRASVASGFFASVVGGLAEWVARLKTLNRIPRIRLGFITFDTAIHFYDIRSRKGTFRMYALSDVADIPATVEASTSSQWPDLPAPPVNFLTVLSEHYDTVTALLAALPSMFPINNSNNNNTSINNGSLFGGAALAARKLCKRWGGRIVTFVASAPTLGPGSVLSAARKPVRDLDGNALLSRPLEGAVGDFYKMLALDAAAEQTAFDVFAAPGPTHKEIATVAQLAQFSGGVVQGYPNFFAEVDGPALAADIGALLGRAADAAGWEAILRLRVSEGLGVAFNHGSMYVRLPELLILPSTHRSMAYTTTLKYTQSALQGNFAYFQSSLLYTNSRSRRMIRVSTLRVPVVATAPAVFEAIDTPTLVTVLAKTTLESVAYDTTVTAARKALYGKAADILRQCVRVCGRHTLAQPPQALAAFPLYVLSLLKHTSLVRIAPDERACIIGAFRTLPPKAILEEVHPQLYDIAEIDLAEAAANPDAVAVPALKALTAASVNQDSVMLFNCGSYLLFYIGKSAQRELLSAVFGTPAAGEAVAQVRTVPSLRELYPDEDPAKFALNTEVRKLVDAFAQARKYVGLYPPRVVVTNNAKLVHGLLVADHTGDFYSYQEFITKLHSDVSTSI